jgi:C4-type Zn-finger protein
MIIYGSRTYQLKSIQLTNEHCPHCGTQGSVAMFTMARYAHIFWIPFFPLGRVSVTQCQHCKQTLEENQMPAQIKAYHHRNLSETRLPLWQFSGLALIFMAIVFGAFANKADAEERSAFLQDPKVGDVYELKTGEGNYTTFRLMDITTDSVIVNYNSYEVNKVTGLPQIDKEENYVDSLVYILSRTELDSMHREGNILDINRK